ncbi:hypothetical protein BAUCODRAFT_518344 [Baudoinia panamericana UAMH 10762]|uniref:Lytic polysaccharide monooxygenase n=1 Tax=Baudoinia panamericana (strain UAMH 10762) TaxID=717646 RepID=M2MTQ8_BAUPA|nr:uncharacterized protein BAUCODRAFT_518344 [Baudoinia panamericana UAMH 10762]EMC94923.1 hypothetical protein BAUCODRAFT_518344 [Baudoinia panamericana UAMH 10762]
MRRQCIYNLLLLLPSALCHMEMSWPYPFRSKYDPANNYENIDYSMTSPLDADGSDFPCKGYQNDESTRSPIAYIAGSTYNVTLAGSAAHGGGSCQLSLSYDNGATFRVVKSMIGGCPLTSTYDLTIPAYAPAGAALLAWTWQNYEGNREFYMNCAAIRITRQIPSLRRRKAFRSFESLPYIWRTNLAGLNNCTTAAEQPPSDTVVYPNPGPDVQYGGGINSSSPATQGDCDLPMPYGQTYHHDSNSASEPVAEASDPAEHTAASSQTSSLNPSQAEAPAAQSRSAGTASTTGFMLRQRPVLTYDYSPPTTITVIVECPSVITITTTVTPGTSTVTQTAVPDHTTTIGVVITASESPVAEPSSAPTSDNNSSSNNNRPVNQPPYATGDLSAYLPCVPGTFICSNSTTFYTCDYNDGSDPSRPSNAYIYDYPRTVAAGMECLPYYSPYASDTTQYAQQPTCPQGYCRDDRYVRYRPDGDCSENGSIMCTDGGQMFDMCDQGGWVQMGSVAAGTTCENGEMVASS